jgi:septal ring factor EnvC (AmiA/AmiB activator)
MLLQMRLAVVLALLVVANPCLAEQSREEATADLEAVVSQLKALNRTVEKQRKQESKAKQELASVEKAEQKARAKLNGIRKEQKTIAARQTELERQAGKQEQQLAEEREILAGQLRAAYINGREEWLRMTLSQEDPVSLSRRQTYYSYLSQARAQLVENVLAKLAELEVTRAEIAVAAAELAELEADVETQLAEVRSRRKEREQIVVSIAAEISSQDQQIASLKAQEGKLRDLIKALDRMLAESKMNNAEPFAGQTASLRWPAQGRILHRFGQPRADGRMKWQGVLIGAAEGSEVKAVYNGRVVFADWLDGLGLLMILEHGDGYMSLYGHNQTLLREVGQTVAKDDVIAEVGDSGGQPRPGLYFEVRKNGSAVNPSSWIK